MVVGTAFAGRSSSTLTARQLAIPIGLATCAAALVLVSTLVGPPRGIPARDAIEALRFSRLPRVQGAPLDGVVEGWRRCRAICRGLMLPIEELGPGPASGGALLGAGLVAAIVVETPRRQEMLRRLRPLAPIAVGVFALLALRGGLGIAAAGDTLLARGVLVLALAIPFETVVAGLPNVRRRAVMVLLVVVFAMGISSMRASRSAGVARAVVVDETTAVTSPWYPANGAVVVDLEGVSDAGALAALRRGELLSFARSRSVRRLFVDERWQDAAFFGARYRESLRADPDDASALLLVRDEAEKNDVLHIPSAGIDLGSLAGRELLSDGWRWVGRPSAPARSIGDVSEIVFVLDGAEQGVVLELTAASVPRVVGDRQEITVSIDGTFVVRTELSPQPAILRLPMPRAASGRRRLRIFHIEPSPPKVATVEGEEGEHAAIEVGLLRLSPLPELPPRGPSFGAPGGAAILASGFMPIEGTGERAAVWAVGPRAEIAFSVTDPQREHVLLLEAGPPPKSAEGDDQVVTLRLGGEDVGTARLVQGDLVVSRFVLPRGVLREGVNRLTLTYTRTSHDEIDRALYVRSIRLE
jgi:hypothetical protein